jgi:hypothetical protein
MVALRVPKVIPIQLVVIGCSRYRDTKAVLVEELRIANVW